jgi:hypothetical protein
VEYATSTGKPGWTPPCPPSGSGTHHYVFWVLALDRLTRVPTSAVTATAIATITEAAFAQGQITGSAVGWVAGGSLPVGTNSSSGKSGAPLALGGAYWIDRSG